MVMKRRRSSVRPNKVYRQDDLEIFDLIEYPVWVFDIDEKAMFWANEVALQLWNADSLESLLRRSFVDDMSESTKRRLNEYMVKFKKGETVQDQWTLYPEGRATPVHLTMSGIQVMTSSGPRMLMLTDATVPRERVDQESLRGVEMLRHLPVAVCQFDLGGRLMSQNPESLELFGSPALETNKSLCSFQSRFVDKALGQQALDAVLAQRDYSLEAQQQTQRGFRWFSISLRLSKDPVTSQPVVLYSARDNTEVMEAKKEAELANNKKSEFLAVMAHELRTPLHQVIGFIDLLSQTKMTEQQLDYVIPMQSASMSLMSVINDLLDYTKIEAGKLQLERIPFDIKGVLEGCQEVMESKTSTKGLSLESSLPPKGLPTVLVGDPNRLRQILLNLLDNSVKFTGAGGVALSVTIQEDEEGGHTAANRVRLRFQVEDTGMGISAEDQQQIFGKYQHASIAVAQQYGGTGLGLAICKSLAEAMGGSISLESELGKGTKVAFEIPFELPKARKATEPVATPLPTEDIAKESLQILVAEDQKINQKVIKAMLQRMGHEVTLANNGALAVEQVENAPEHFDVIIMDKEMPELGGIEATKLLRKKGYKIPIVGLTASYQPSDRQYYKDSGMNDCIAKPARQQKVREVLNDVMKPSDKSTARLLSSDPAGDSGTGKVHPIGGAGGKNIDYQGNHSNFPAKELDAKGRAPQACLSEMETLTKLTKYARLA